MNKQELAIAKKIAEIEGIELREHSHSLYGFKSVYKPEGGIWQEYNPFDWSILGPLMVRHKVGISYDNQFVFIDSSFDYSASYYKSDEDLPRAILECIIKSQEA